MNYRDQIVRALRKLVSEKDLNLELTENMKFGDYSSNVAMQIFSRLKVQALKPETNSQKRKLNKKGNISSYNLKIDFQALNMTSPRQLAQIIVNKLRGDKELSRIVDRIEIAGPGFINFWLTKPYLIKELEVIAKLGDKYGSSNLMSGMKILLEHTSPNPQTTIMLGHLRNNFLGMSIANLLEFLGAEVKKDCIVNDRGIHICRSIFGYLAFAYKGSLFTSLTLAQLKKDKEISDEVVVKIALRANWQKLLNEWVKNKSDWVVPRDLQLKPDHANLIWYVLGSKAYKLSKSVHKQVGEILQAWEKEDKKVWAVWRQILSWSNKGYQETYQRIGSSHDWVWYESKLYKEGRSLVAQGLKKGVFRRSEGAVVTNLAKYHLSDTVIIKSDGTSTYFVFDLNLTLQKQKKFPSDLYIWTIGTEQTLYFKQMFAICEQLGIGRREDFYHLSYALINFKGGGKMATREGSVVKADEILDELEEKVLKIIRSSDQDLRGKLKKREIKRLVKQVALGAIKYSLLKYARHTTIYYDVDESISLQGNSGPYLQYTYTRAQSLLQKAKKAKSKVGFDSRFLRTLSQLNSEEILLLRTLIQFPEVIVKTAKSYAPNLLGNYLFDLAQKYNTFYDRHQIIGSKNFEFRLYLTSATGQIIKNGLRLLGIQVPEKM